MTNSQLATASLDDIVFDGRNQRYGAYQLRGLYQRHVTRALVIATAIFALLMAFPLVAQYLKDKTPVAAVPKAPANPTLVNFEETVSITPPPAAAKPPVQPPQPPTVKDLALVVVKESVPTREDDVPNRDELIEKASGLETAAGDPGASPNAGPGDLEPGLEKGLADEAVKDKPYLSVEQMPELPGGGGQLAIVKAIQLAVRYPRTALSNGIEGKIYVSFTVNPKGEVVDVKIVKGLGYGLDEETMRAINALPRFIPGKQNGREVSVSFTVPVTYKIQ